MRTHLLKRVLTAIAAFLGFALFVLVMLVLLGIIAEPETVIERVVRMLFGT